MCHRIAFGSLLAVAIVVSGCAAAPSSRVPYPAFVQTGELEDAFTAALPGTRAKQMFLDGRSGRASILLSLPSDWSWNSGGKPGMSVEVYVLEGEILLGDLTLHRGNYAYLPPGSTGLTMSTESGARLLYFRDEADPHSVIRTPLFMSRDVVPWQPLSEDAADAGLQRKLLRSDPGSGARTWLLKVEAGARYPRHKSTAMIEGFLLTGDYQGTECVAGQSVTGVYTPGGYFRRPADAISGGPAAGSEQGAVWFMREPTGGTVTPADSCPVGEAALQDRAADLT